MEEIFFSDKEKKLQTDVMRFLNKELDPIKDQIDNTNEIPIDLIRELGKKGLFGPLISKEFGGTGLGMINHMIITEEIAQLNVSVSVTILFIYNEFTNFI